MMALDYAGPITQEALFEQRKLYSPDKNIRSAIMAAVSGTGYYATTPILFDISHWNGKIINGVNTPITDFKYWADHKEYFGVYIKCGEAYGNATWRDAASNYWYDVLCDQHVTGAYAVGSWIALYEMYEPAWFLNRGISMGNVSQMFKGATDDETAMNLMDDPNITIYMRKTKIGIGRDFTAARFKSLPNNKVISALVIDLEKWYTSSGAVVSDLHMGFALRNTIDGLRWLMNKGYMGYYPIIIYTSDWFLRTYGNVITRQVCDENDCIDAGYYWNQNILGTKPVTFEELLSDLATIPNSWHPTYVGKTVFALQVSGDYFKMFGSAQDINCVKRTWSELAEMFPLWKARRDAYYGGAIPPEPIDPPIPVPTKLVVRPKNGAVNMRRGIGTTTTNSPIGQLYKGVPADVIRLETIGKDTWALVDPQGPIWMCVSQNGVPIMTITEEPK